jgi:flagellar biosynthesis protein FlhF
VQLKSYRAWTMNDALAAVKRDLGADAVILNTRTFKRGGFLRMGRRTVIEVTAARAADMQKARAADGAGESKVAPIAARRAYAAVAGPSLSSQPDAQQRSMTASDGSFERQRTRLLAQAMAATQARQGATESTPPPAKATRPTPPGECRQSPQSDGRPTVMQTSASQMQVESIAAPMDAVARRFILTPAATSAMPAPISVSAAAEPPGRAADTEIQPKRGRSIDGRAKPRPGKTPAARHAGDSANLPLAADVHEELAAIKGLVGRVLRGQTGTLASTPPGALFDMYLKLINQDVSAELADRIVGRVRDRLGPELLDDLDAVRGAICDEMCRLIPSAGDQPPPSRRADRPFVLALIGPTGVGKTTTVAKLAATFKLKHQRSVGMITCDTYRIAAVDQLRTYADIIGVPLEVALSPSEMHRAIASLAQCDIVLIDTAGRGQNDSQRLDELREFIDAASPDEVHLVLSSTAGERVLMREAEAFAAVRVDRIVLTKLDEAVGMGMVVNVIHRVGKELSFVTTGQEVPEHIEPGSARKLAAMVLDGHAAAVSA